MTWFGFLLTEQTVMAASKLTEIAIVVAAALAWLAAHEEKSMQLPP
jgi:hypothetical protein